MKYLLNCEKLLPGDIILTTYDDDGSEFIREETHSKYSHAMLYVDMSIIEATSKGVFSCSPQRMLFHEKSDVIVLRYCNLSNEQQRDIVNSARFKVGTLYSYKEAYSTLYLNETSTSAKSFKQFCSRLVAQAYKKANIPIVRNSDYCTPQDIFMSEKLKEVSEDYLCPPTPLDLYVCGTPDLVRENQEITYQWLANVRKLAQTKGFEVHCINHIFSFISKFKEYDILICDWANESGYCTHYLAEKIQNSYRYDKDSFIEFYTKWRHPQIKGKKQGLANAIYGESLLTRDIILNQGRNYIASVKSYKDSQFHIFEMHCGIYKGILSLCREKLLVLLEVSKHIDFHDLDKDITYKIQLIENLFTLTYCSPDHLFKEFSRAYKCPNRNLTSDSEGNFFIPTTDDFEYDENAFT